MPYRRTLLTMRPLEAGDQFDTVAEVDACYRAQRRLSFTYGGIFLAITLTIPLLTATAPAWNNQPVWGGFTLNYLVVAILYHVAYVLLGLAYTIQANRLEDEILGSRDE